MGFYFFKRGYKSWNNCPIHFWLLGALIRPHCKIILNLCSGRLSCSKILWIQFSRRHSESKELKWKIAGTSKRTYIPNPSCWLAVRMRWQYHLDGDRPAADVRSRHRCGSARAGTPAWSEGSWAPRLGAVAGGTTSHLVWKRIKTLLLRFSFHSEFPLQSFELRNKSVTLPIIAGLVVTTSVL